MELDKVSAANFYQDNGDKVKLNWLLYEYANLLYLKIAASPKLVRYRNLYSQDQITAFCVYFSKRLRKSIYDLQTDRLKSIAFDGKYVYCLLYTSDAADEEDSVDLGGRRIIKKKK